MCKCLLLMFCFKNEIEIKTEQHSMDDHDVRERERVGQRKQGENTTTKKEERCREGERERNGWKEQVKNCHNVCARVRTHSSLCTIWETYYYYWIICVCARECVCEHTWISLRTKRELLLSGDDGFKHTHTSAGHTLAHTHTPNEWRSVNGGVAMVAIARRGKTTCTLSLTIHEEEDRCGKCGLYF